MLNLQKKTMKKITLLLIVCIAFSQCSQKFSIAKRRYNKGFYIASSKKPENAQPKQNTAVKKETKEQAVLATASGNKPTELATKGNINTTAIENNEFKTWSHSSNTINTQKSTSITTKNNYNLTAQAKGKTFVKQQSDQRALSSALLLNKLIYKGKKADDTNTLILVILSLFPVICLIAVYLKDGKSITMNFWIDLLLHITVIGAIIFAPLVVLDIINLA